MIQVASAFSSIINGGNYYKPTVLAGTLDASGKYNENTPTAVRRTISKSTSDQVKEVLRVARNSSFSSVDKPGYMVGGKTGTSQVIINGQYSADESVGSYIGYGGTDAARYVIMIQVSGKNKILQGARDAMPIFTDISNWMLGYLRLQPKE